MRRLDQNWREICHSSLSEPVAPPVKTSAPVDPKEMKMHLDILGVPSSEGGRPPKFQPSWLKVQLDRLKRFFIKLLHDASRLP